MVQDITAPITLKVDLNLARRAAVRAAEAASDAVIRTQLDALRPSDDLLSAGSLSFADGHSGDAPIPLDATAREAMRAVLDHELPEVIGTARFHEAGEEAGGGTTVVRRGDFIRRTDELDGSTNADCLLNNHSAVVGLDLVREPAGADRRAQHLVGAIALSTCITVSWINDSQWVRELGRHRSHRGRVFVSSTARNISDIEVGDARWNRRARAYAGVASKRGRLSALLSAIDGEHSGDVIWNVAGTPIVAGLIAGALTENIEVERVSLHDSLHLIPHQLLGGTILDLASGAPLDYLALYERETVDLDPKAKPVPAYRAIAGLFRER